MIIASGDDHTCLICFEPKSTSTRLMEMSLLTSRVKWWVFGLGLKEWFEDWTWFEDEDSEDAWRAHGRWEQFVEFNLFNRDVLAAKGQVDRWQDDPEKFSDQYSPSPFVFVKKEFCSNWENWYRCLIWKFFREDMSNNTLLLDLRAIDIGCTQEKDGHFHQKKLFERFGMRYHIPHTNSIHPKIPLLWIRLSLRNPNPQ